MNNRRYTDEFKVEAAKHITEHCDSVYDVALRSGVSPLRLYAWRKEYGQRLQHATSIDDQESEVNWLRPELKRATKERDSKKATAYFAQAPRRSMPLSGRTIDQLATPNLCGMMRFHWSGDYA